MKYSSSHFLLSIQILFLMTLFSCKKETPVQITIATNSSEEIKSDSLQSYQEPFRPQFHFSPEKKWMNDPNGMVYYKGIYHLFYQYYPNDIVWGPMHWGHATSLDLIHWSHHKIALYPDELGLIFSGSAVVDYTNSSGLGTKENPAMIAIFTYHNMAFEKAGKINTQSQGLAYSLDDGDTWTKYKGNPIIPNATLKDFRDPKVFWNSETKLWNLTLVAGDHAQFYTSANLKNWTLTGEFGRGIGAHGGVWECPDLFKLPVGNTQEEKWVLLISINPGAPKGGSGTQYFIGDFDGKTFTTNQKEVKWIDFGTDNYAGVTYNDAPDQQRIFIGWMSNWSYARNTPTHNWRSAMTLPRTLTLDKINGEYVVKSTPVSAVKKQFLKVYSKANITLKASEKAIINYKNFNQSQVQFKAKAANLTLVFSNDVHDSLVLKYNEKQKTMVIDRRHSGLVNFEPSFAKSMHTSDVKNLTSEEIEFEIFLDWSSVEVFLNDGLYSFTEQIFSKKPYSKLVIQSNENQEIKNLEVNQIKSIWTNH